MRSIPAIRMRTARALALSALLAFAVAASAQAAGVHAALQPAHITLEPDSTCSIDLVITAADASFNSFTAVIGYDPSALTFLPASPLSLQQGCLLTGTCSGACGATFDGFAAAGDSLVIQQSVLCDAYSLTGPGQLYRLNFQAGSTHQTTFVRVRRIVFYNAGLFVTPVSSADAQVDIQGTASVAAGATGAGLRLGVVPNPARGALSLSIAAGSAGPQTVDVLDLAGRRVRQLDEAWYAPGSRVLRWDGAGADGSRLPSGIYLVRVRAGNTVAQSRVVLLR